MKKKVYALYIRPEVIEMVREIAQEDNRALSNQIETLMLDFIKLNRPSAKIGPQNASRRIKP